MPSIHFTNQHNTLSERFKGVKSAAIHCRSRDATEDTVHCFRPTSLQRQKKWKKKIISTLAAAKFKKMGTRSHRVLDILAECVPNLEYAHQFSIQCVPVNWHKTVCWKTFAPIYQCLTACWGRHACLQGSKANQWTGGERNPFWLSKWTWCLSWRPWPHAAVPDVMPLLSHCFSVRSR